MASARRPSQPRDENDYPVEQGRDEAPVFSSPSEHRPAEGGDEPVHEPRPPTPEQHLNTQGAHREDEAGGPASNHEPAFEEETIDVIVDRVLIHDDKPMEKLPALQPPELKIIGRCVTFHGTFKVDDVERKMFYEGLVATINRDTLTLMHVHRYTEADFEQYKNDYGKDNSESFRPAKQHGVAAVTAMPGEREERTLANMGGADSNEMGFNAESQLPQSPAPQRDQDDHHEEVTKCVRNKLKGRTGTLGPIPFMTFARSRIHNVEFGRDPRSSFYSLFQDPSKSLMDMQYLRMFVRRYIVHTSQGNNPRHVPLRAFVTVRCACPDLDNDLLLSVTREEVAHLVKAERAIRRGKRTMERERRALISTYRAPNGLFRDTGLIYLTKIPLATFVVGAITFGFTAVFIVYAALVVAMAEPYVVMPYLRQFTPYITASSIVWVISVVLTIYHAVRLRLPVSDHKTLLSLRVLLLLGSIGCGLMIMITMGRSFTATESRNFLLNQMSSLGLSYYYEEYHCSGFLESCVDYPASKLCRVPNSGFPTPCHRTMLSQFEKACLPLVIFACIVFFLSVIQIYLAYRFVAVGHLIERRLATAGERVG